MKHRILLAADSLSRFQPRFDTTLRLATELLRRGHEVDYLDLDELDEKLPPERTLATLPVQKIRTSDADAVPFIEVNDPRPENGSAYSLIFQRKDPPVDARYRFICDVFSQLPDSVVQINNPKETPRYYEHELPIFFPSDSIPTFIAEDVDAFVKAVRAEPVEAVAKPMNECSGNGVEFFRPDAPREVLAAYFQKWGPRAIVQPFIDEVTRSGDLRILVMNRKVMGSVLRVPKKGSRLANLHQGASYVAFTPTPRQLEITKRVANELTPRGLYLLGLDFIGDRLSEINVTSPSALQQINEVMNTDIAIPLIDECEALMQSKI